jgi:hypothetical protein
MIKPAATALCLLATITLFSQTLIPYRSGELWGYCTPNKKIVIEPKYERAGWFFDGLALVAKGCNADCYDRYDGKWGYIDEKGREVIAFQYDEAFRFINGKTYARQGDSWFELNTKGVHVQKLDEAPDFTVKQYEMYLEDATPKGYYMMELGYYIGNLNEKGYVNKKGEEFWSDPEEIFFFGINAKDIKGGDDWPGQPQLTVSHPLFKYLKHKLGEQNPPQLFLVRNDGNEITVEKSFRLKQAPNGGEGETVFYITDFDAVKPYVSKIDPNAKDYKLVFACSIQTPAESMVQNILFNLMRFDIQFIDVAHEHNMICYHTSPYEFSTEYTQNEITNAMIEDLHTTGRAMKEQGDRKNIKIEGAQNPYAGKMLLDVMEQAVLDDVWQFLGYVQARPFIYIGGRWKFADAFATWVAGGAPRVVVKK